LAASPQRDSFPTAAPTWLPPDLTRHRTAAVPSPYGDVTSWPAAGPRPSACQAATRRTAPAAGQAAPARSAWPAGAGPTEAARPGAGPAGPAAAEPGSARAVRIRRGRGTRRGTRPRRHRSRWRPGAHPRAPWAS